MTAATGSSSIDEPGSSMRHILFRHGYDLATAALALLFFVSASGWALVMPAFSGPDETAHYNSVVRLLDGGGWPRPYDATYEQSTISALLETGRTFRDQSLERLPSPDDRSTLLGGGEWDELATDYMVQHPPGYYVVVAAVVAAVGGGDLRWDHALMTMRMVSALLVAGAVPFIVGISRRVSGSRSAGIAGGAIVLFVPFVANLAGYVSNDSLLILGCSASLYFAVRALDHAKRPLGLLALSGVALGVALGTKGLALMLIPVVAVIAIAVAWKLTGWFRRICAVALPLLIAFVIGGWWWLRNIVVLGKIQPSIYGRRTSSGSRHPDYDLSFFVEQAVYRLNSTFWGRGARADLALPEVTAIIAGTLLLTVVAVSVVFARRRLLLFVVWAFPLAILGVTLWNAHGIYWDLGSASRGVQGRYVFAGIAAIASSMAVVFVAYLRFCWARGRAGGFALVLTLACGIMASWTALIWTTSRVWAGVSDASFSSGVPLIYYIAVPVTAALVSVVLIVSALSVTKLELSLRTATRRGRAELYSR
ncbi:hypothetical protein FHX48_001724 [Microbacterium halimionae]|uniref:ArnT-like N-terminal domain-containing protein n=1 Tax=Microbacterium halimionae TaxID=1526413 RepID=A0A7W3JPJ2_9MICO|nr:DUF2142 domain-containing protein [Microbacterium halimionae]MBA8816651.1 hypothetical protein [Microbacterium halimionae]NII95162.1 hypothetical protein [Microbacterium halimionae]